MWDIYIKRGKLKGVKYWKALKGVNLQERDYDKHQQQFPRSWQCLVFHLDSRFQIWVVLEKAHPFLSHSQSFQTFPYPNCTHCHPLQTTARIQPSAQRFTQAMKFEISIFFHKKKKWIGILTSKNEIVCFSGSQINHLTRWVAGLQRFPGVFHCFRWELVKPQHKLCLSQSMQTHSSIQDTKK